MRSLYIYIWFTGWLATGILATVAILSCRHFAVYTYIDIYRYTVANLLVAILPSIYIIFHVANLLVAILPSIYIIFRVANLLVAVYEFYIFHQMSLNTFNMMKRLVTDQLISQSVITNMSNSEQSNSEPSNCEQETTESDGPEIHFCQETKKIRKSNWSFSSWVI